MTVSPVSAEVASVRAFNRLYTLELGLLNKHLDASAYTLSEARVLYEIAHGDGLTAAEIGRMLDMDRAQLSRVLAKLQRERLVEAVPSPEHAKHRLLSLTEEGRLEYAELEGKTRKAVAGLLSGFPEGARERFVEAARTMQGVLEREPSAAAFTLRAPRVGELGWIVHRQAALYAEEYGWDWSYEALVAKILAGFVENFDPAREAAWVAESNGSVVGSIFLVRGDRPEVAKLRLLYVEGSARGMGVGRALVRACIDRAREVGYKRMELWTNSVLAAARRIYESEGFHLVREEPHHSFGKDLVGQIWELDLTVQAARPLGR